MGFRDSIVVEESVDSFIKEGGSISPSFIKLKHRTILVSFNLIFQFYPCVLGWFISENI